MLTLEEILRVAKQREKNAMANQGTAQIELRQDKIDGVNQAIGKVRDLVAELNEREKEYLRNNSVTYRQLVDTIKSWKAA